MHIDEPKIYIIAQTEIIGDDNSEFIDALGASEWDTEAKSGSEILIEEAGRMCYKSFNVSLNPNLTKVREGNDEYIANILDSGHGSVLEHGTVTVAMLNVSRILTHELVRHRAGFAYSQESMRFVRMTDIGMYIPECIKENPEALNTFKEAVNSSENYYNTLVKLMISDDMPFHKKKEITSAIRRIAPSGHSTNIIATGNHRAWRHTIELRTKDGVEEEIKKVFHMIAVKFQLMYPAIYQDMSLVHDNWKSPVTFDNSKV